MRLAVDEHGADPAGALAAAVFRREVAEPAPQRREQVVGRIHEGGPVGPVEPELDGKLGHRVVSLLASRSRPRCTGSTSRRYHSLAIASVAGRVPSAATWRAAPIAAASSGLPSRARSTPLARIGVGRHGAVGDPRPGDPPARHRQIGGDREDRDPLRPHPARLAEAEIGGAGGPRELHRRDEALAAALAGGEELLERHRAAAAVARLHRDLRVEREQSDREVAVRSLREEVAADRRGVADGRTADRARRRVEEREVAAGEHGRHRDPGAELDPAAAGLDPARRPDP